MNLSTAVELGDTDAIALMDHYQHEADCLAATVAQAMIEGDDMGYLAPPLPDSPDDGPLTFADLGEDVGLDIEQDIHADLLAERIATGVVLTDEQYATAMIEALWLRRASDALAEAGLL